MIALRGAAVLAACLSLSGTLARAESWTFESFDDTRSGRTISQAEVADAAGYLLIVRCDDGGTPWLAVRFGQDDPQWPGGNVALRAKVGDKSWNLGRFQYSLSVYEAPVPREFLAALASGSQVTLEGATFGFERTFGLAGSGQALGHLNCH